MAYIVLHLHCISFLWSACDRCMTLKKQRTENSKTKNSSTMLMCSFIESKKSVLRSCSIVRRKLDRVVFKEHSRRYHRRKWIAIWNLEKTIEWSIHGLDNSMFKVLKPKVVPKSRESLRIPEVTRGQNYHFSASMSFCDEGHYLFSPESSQDFTRWTD